MAVLTKAQLRTAIDAVFASMQKISAEQARAEYHDWIDSLLDSEAVVAGSGITVSRSAGVVTVAAGGAAAATGLPSFVMTSAAQPSDDVLTATITGVTNSPPFPSVVYLITPSGLNRAADDLELRVNGDVSRVRSLVDFRGDGLTARDLDPAALYELLAHASPNEQYRLTEPIPQRRQDYSIRVFWSDSSGTIVPAGEASFDTPTVTIPVYTGTRSDTSILFLGVPNVAPNIAPDIIQAGRRGGPPLYFREVDTADYAGEITTGVAGKWVRTNTRVNFAADSGFPTSAGHQLFIESAYL